MGSNNLAEHGGRWWGEGVGVVNWSNTGGVGTDLPLIFEADILYFVVTFVFPGAAGACRPLALAIVANDI